MQALSASREKKASGELVTVGDRKITPWIKGREKKKTDLGRQMERGQDRNIHTDGKLCLQGGFGPGIDLRRSL